MRSAAVFLLVFLVAVLATDGARSQVGPGIPRTNYKQNELFTIIGSLGSGSHGRAMMHRGYLGTLRSGSGIQFWNISNPYAPALVSSITGMGLSEPHTFAITTAFGGEHLIAVRGSGLGGKGFGIWTITDVQRPSTLTTYSVPGVAGGYATACRQRRSCCTAIRPRRFRTAPRSTAAASSWQPSAAASAARRARTDPCTCTTSVGRRSRR